MIDEWERQRRVERELIVHGAQEQARQALAAILSVIGHPVTVTRAVMADVDRNALYVSEDPATGDLTYSLRPAPPEPG